MDSVEFRELVAGFLLQEADNHLSDCSSDGCCQSVVPEPNRVRDLELA